MLENRVHHNSNRGIESMANFGLIRGNEVFANATGLYAGGASTQVLGNLFYDNTQHAIVMQSATSSPVHVENNTIYHETGDAVRVEGGTQSARFFSNIFQVEGGFALSVATDSQAGFSSNYNLFHLTGAGKVVEWQGVAFDNVVDWFLATGFDGNSGEGDPLFVDPAGRDFHLLPGSPAIDRGVPNRPYLEEPSPNGGRINIGRYGNTPEATASSAQLVQVLAPNGLQKFEVGQEVAVSFRSSGLTAERTVALFNAGGGSVDNWLDENLYLVQGDSRNTAGAIDLSLVTDPAPAAVYNSYLAAVNGAGNSLIYDLALPDGVYDVRLHFMEPSGIGPGVR
ncbi:MAG: hypothetical protein GWO24_23905, partial [Akkermansiaceae bacterium]|nr:hypothetical protein [Akkermansiaceae bacterium]